MPVDREAQELLIAVAVAVAAVALAPLVAPAVLEL
jgi:hypothetical protein